MKTLVTYYSRSGNTKKVAEAIYEEIKSEKDLLEIEKVSNVEDYDLIFVGTPIEKHEPVKHVIDFIQEKAHNKKIALFITHAAAEHMDFVVMYVEKYKQLIKEPIELIGVFNCQGELSQEIANHMLKSENPQLQKFAQMRQYTLNQPDSERIVKAKNFAKDVLRSVETSSKIQRIEI
ncbi:MAG: flavodoxin [Candidatus Heimdallarchaeota archaeon]|nr:flavodoxin [Candidatus Heimdallarchaeota archaeon]